MKKLLYKGIEFDDFQLYREAENSSGCEYGYPTDENLNTKDWEEADVYIRCVEDSPEDIEYCISKSPSRLPLSLYFISGFRLIIPRPEQGTSQSTLSAVCTRLSSITDASEIFASTQSIPSLFKALSISFILCS